MGDKARKPFQGFFVSQRSANSSLDNVSSDEAVVVERVLDSVGRQYVACTVEVLLR